MGIQFALALYYLFEQVRPGSADAELATEEAIAVPDQGEMIG